MVFTLSVVVVARALRAPGLLLTSLFPSTGDGIWNAEHSDLRQERRSPDIIKDCDKDSLVGVQHLNRRVAAVKHCCHYNHK